MAACVLCGSMCAMAGRGGGGDVQMDKNMFVI